VAQAHLVAIGLGMATDVRSESSGLPGLPEERLPLMNRVTPMNAAQMGG
jgi:hypothetical protein